MPELTLESLPSADLIRPVYEKSLPSADSIRFACPVCGSGRVRSDDKSIWCGEGPCQWHSEKSLSLVGTIPDHVLRSEIERAATETDTNPSPEQKESGKYAKGKFQIRNLTVAIENPKGSTRSGVDKFGNPWSIQMQSHYGYIIKVEGQKSLQYETKGMKEGTCGVGERSDLTGCTPASGEISAKKEGEQEEEAEQKDKKGESTPPIKQTMSDEEVIHDSWMDSFRMSVTAYSNDKDRRLGEAPIGDLLRALDMKAEGKLPSIKFTDKYKKVEDIRFDSQGNSLPYEKSGLRTLGIDYKTMSNKELYEALQKNGLIEEYPSEEGSSFHVIGIDANVVLKKATPEERSKLIPYFAKQLAKYDGKDGARSYILSLGSYGGASLTPDEKKVWADSIEDEAGGAPLKTKFDEDDGKDGIDYDSSLTVARIGAWAHTRNYDAFLSGMAGSWSTTGSGVDAQRVMNSVASVDVPQNQGKSFWSKFIGGQQEGAEAPVSFDKERVSQHLLKLKKSTEDFYKKKFGKKKADSFDLSTKELVAVRGVGGKIAAYLPSPVESWSADKSTANRFGKQMAKKEGEFYSSGPKYFTVLRTKVTYADVLFSYETMKDVPGWPVEKRLKGKKEFVLFGGSLQNTEAEVFHVSR
jgi:hypothetical protein